MRSPAATTNSTINSRSPYWPPGLPEPLNGNKFTSAEQRMSSQGDIMPRHRVCDPNYCQTLSVSWTMTEDQYRAFESWYFHRLYDGVSKFYVEWAERPGWARFIGTVQAQQSGSNWQLSGEAFIDYAIS